MNYLLGLNGEPITDRVSSMFRGVGLIRGEYLCRRAQSWVASDTCQQAIADYCEHIAALFAPDPVWYRFVEMETAEVNLLPGADHRLFEKTTMLGLRGIRRSQQYPETFEREAAAVIAVARHRPNLHLLLPFVHDVSEAEFAANALSGWGFANRLGMMAEIPSAILTLGDFFSAGISHVTIGMNDLTALTLGLDRQSQAYRPLHPAVLKLVRIAVDSAHGAGVKLSVAGYHSVEALEVLQTLGCDNAVLHYSNLAGLLPSQFADLAHQVDLRAIKADIRLRVATSLAAQGEAERATA